MRATRNAQGVGRSASARYSRMAPSLAALAFTRICTEVQQVASHCRRARIVRHLRATRPWRMILVHQRKVRWPLACRHRRPRIVSGEHTNPGVPCRATGIN